MGLRGLLAGKGQSGFNELYRSGTTREVVCLAHIRRKFVDIIQSQTSAIAK
jgi:transposase